MKGSIHLIRFGGCSLKVQILQCADLNIPKVIEHWW